MISSIENGNMRPNLEQDGLSAQANFDAFCESHGVSGEDYVGLRIDPAWQDGARVATQISPDVVPGSVYPYDRQPAHAVILPRDKGVFVLSADCYPFVLSATEHHAVGHIGWRSVDDFLLGKVVNEFLEMGYSPDSLLLHLGPGISAVSNVVHLDEATQLTGANVSRWEQYVQYVTDSHVRINLSAAILEAARQFGIKKSNTTVDERDTYTDPQLYSRRATLQGEDKPRGNHVFIAEAEA